MRAADLEEVNTEVNALPYVADAFRYHQEDFWDQISESGGDCEDYALAKLNRLVERGWPIEALRLACCYVETGGYHAVLQVDVDGKQVVLDNRFPWPMTLNELTVKGYKPDCIQAYGGALLNWCEWKWQ